MPSEPSTSTSRRRKRGAAQPYWRRLPSPLADAFTLENPIELPAVARHIGKELRTQYVPGYRPEDMPKDGKWLRIQVKLRLPKKLSFCGHVPRRDITPAE